MIKTWLRPKYHSFLNKKRSFQTRLARVSNTKLDSSTGLYCQNSFGRTAYLRSRRDYHSDKDIKSVCDGVYFKFYKPSGSDVVLDIGAGFGQEALYLIQDNPDVTYFGVEVQPTVYECLANTFSSVRPSCSAIPIAISTEDKIHISSLLDYSAVGAANEGYIEIPSVTWEDFKRRYDIRQVDLLKVNIEGGERMLLPTLGDMADIKRVIISAHDFRADRGEGDYFRTREFVRTYLSERGFETRPVAETGWLTNWIYGEKPCRKSVLST